MVRKRGRAVVGAAPSIGGVPLGPGEGPAGPVRAASPASALRKGPPSLARVSSGRVSRPSPTGSASPRSSYEGTCVILQNRAPGSLRDKRPHGKGALESHRSAPHKPPVEVSAPRVYAGPQPSTQPTPWILAGPTERWDTAGNRSAQPPRGLEGSFLTYCVN